MSIALSLTGRGTGRGREGAHAGRPDVQALRRECRRIVRRRALLGAASSLIPLPGVDLVTDVALLLRLIPDINRHFGLSEDQIEALSPARRALAYRLMVSAGGMLAARVTTAEILRATLRYAGIRLTLMEASRLVPIAGQLLAAAIGYGALNYVLGRHIDACAALAERIRSA